VPQVKKVQAWLKREFGKEFTDNGNKMTHGKQEDDFSCGVVLPNSMEQELFGATLFVHAA
jgi:hypothetical protein